MCSLDLCVAPFLKRKEIKILNFDYSIVTPKFNKSVVRINDLIRDLSATYVRL